MTMSSPDGGGGGADEDTTKVNSDANEVKDDDDVVVNTGGGGGALDDDDDIDEEDAEEGEKVFDLARRTGEIMDRYREYITEIGTSGAGTSGGGSGSGDASAALAPHNPFRYDIHADIDGDDEGIVAYDGSNDYSTQVVSAAASFLTDLGGKGSSSKGTSSGSKTGSNTTTPLDWYGTGGIRDFTIPEEGDDEDEEHGATAGGLYSKQRHSQRSTSSSSSSSHHYQYNMLKSKRFKRWILTFLLMVSVIAIAVGVSKSIKQRNLPDWEKELEEEEEAEKNQQGMVEEPIANQEPTTETTYSNINGISPVLAHALDAEGLYINMAVKYKPVWYSRDIDQYDGSNYEAGVEYCALRNPSMLPCPYEAYCPEGEHTVPAGGYKGEEEGIVQWAPVLDESTNKWVQVSPNDNNACVMYETLNGGADPEWGISGTNPDQTKYLLCCDESAFFEDTASSSIASTATGDDGTVATTETEATTATATTAPAEGDVSAETIVSDVLSHAINTTQSDSFDTKDKYLEMAYKYQPIWYSRDEDNYLGKSFTDGVEFCAAQNPAMLPCTFEAYCPGGMRNAPAGGYQGDEHEAIQWAPFIDYVDAWVQVSSHDGNACVPFDILNGEKPTWAENGVNEQQTRHIMCCATSAFEDASPATDTTNAVTSSEGEILASAYGPDEEEDHPQWYNRDSGWSGTTYLAAQEFCADKVNGTDENGMNYMGVLCSYEDYCPAGPHDLPYGGAPMSSTLQWAPMRDFENEWVQVGGERDMCLPYSSVSMEKPSWGESGTNEEGTQFVLCCRMQQQQFQQLLPETPVTESAATTVIPDVLIHAINTTESEPDDSDANYIEMVYKYQPVWFSRNEGNYLGKTLLDAIEFCSGVHNSVPCPYEAYCPGGPHKVPAGGYQGNENEVAQFAPVFGGVNLWVQVSSIDGNECVTYNDLFGMPPQWGESGTNEQQTRYLMCCDMAAFETPSESGNTVDEVIADAVSSQSVPDSGEIVTTEYGQVDDDHPQWYNRDSGWVGRTYAEAVDFCSTHDVVDSSGVSYDWTLCSYEAYCPDGRDGLPFGGVSKATSVQWAAMSDLDNEWVQVGSDTGTCITYTTLNMEKPSWGINGGSEENTQFILCCRVKKDGSTQQITDEQVPTDGWEQSGAETVGQEIGTILEHIDSKYKLVAFGRNEGWEGSTYDQAATFCSEKVASYVPCSYSALCPNGLADFSSTDGAIWAPIDGVVYSYVELGVGGYCVGQTTLPSYEDATRYVLCCLQQ